MKGGGFSGTFPARVTGRTWSRASAAIFYESGAFEQLPTSSSQLPTANSQGDRRGARVSLGVGVGSVGRWKLEVGSCRRLSARLSFKKSGLSSRTPTIAADAARRRDDAVAGHHQCDRVGGARACHGANRARTADTPGHFG